MKFKHSLEIEGTEENKRRFEKSLTKIGYINAEPRCGPNCRYILVSGGLESFIGNGMFAFQASYGNKRELTFNIDNEWEYKAALAIASIVDDDESHVGEVWKYNTAKPGLYTISRKEGDNCSLVGLNNTVINDRYGRIPETDRKMWFKATPEEIITHFKPKGKFLKTTEMKEEFVLPEKWALKCNNEEEADALRRWAGFDDRTYTTEELTYSLFHYPNFGDFKGTKKGSHTSKPLYEGYTEITFEQFKKYVMKEEGKKIKEYKLKHSAKQFEKAAAAIAYVRVPMKTMGTFLPISECFDRLSKAGVLDLWFEPVYEEENKVVKFNVGNPSKEVTIDSKGSIIIHERKFSIGEIKEVLRGFGTKMGPFGDHYTEVFVKKLWVGCSSEGTEITQDEVVHVIDAYNKLQS